MSLQANETCQHPSEATCTCKDVGDPRIELFVCPECHCSNHVGISGLHVCWSCRAIVMTEPSDTRYGLSVVTNPGPGIAVQLHDENWRYCDPERFQRTLDRAERFQDMGASYIVVWYDDREDYMRIEFTLDGSRYLIRIYRIFSGEKDGVSSFVRGRSWSQDWEMFRFFETRKHRDWDVTSPADT